MYAGFSALVMGRKSYDVYVATGGGVGPALPVYVYSRTLPEGTRDGVTVARDLVSHVRALEEPRPTASRCGSGAAASCSGTLAEAGLVDGVDVAVIPILLGGGLPLLPVPGPRLPLVLRSHRLYAASGTLFLEYDVRRP